MKVLAAICTVCCVVSVIVVFTFIASQGARFSNQAISDTFNVLGTVALGIGDRVERLEKLAGIETPPEPTKETKG